MGNKCSTYIDLFDSKNCVKKRQEIFDKYFGIKMDNKTKLMHKVIELK